MAAQTIWVPVYVVGADGKKAYQFAKLTGVMTNTHVPEGEPCINSRAMTVTPSTDLQPSEAP
jgi:hypothetical protein